MNKELLLKTPINLSQLYFSTSDKNRSKMASFLKQHGKKPYHLFFHVTLKKNWKQIKHDGILKPKIGKRSSELGEFEPRIYLFNNFLDSVDGSGDWLGDAFENTNPEYNDDNLDDNMIDLVIRLNLHDNNLDNQINNPSSFESHYYGNIPTKDIVAVYTPF